MYRRYQPGHGIPSPKPGKPPVGEIGRMPRQTQKQEKMQKTVAPAKQVVSPDVKQSFQERNSQKKGNSLFSLLPEGIYNRETKKILGVISAEDLLLAALIFLLLDSKDGEDSILVYVLLYILLSDYIELPF